MTETITSFKPLLAMLRSNVLAFDVYTFVVMAVYTILALIYYPYVTNAAGLVLQNVVIATAIASLILLTTFTSIPFFQMMRLFYVVPIIYIMYGQVHQLVPAVHSTDYDSLLIEADRVLTGGIDPTVWLAQFSWAPLTEYLQVCYFLFYVLPIMQGIELYRRGNIEELTVFARGMTFCYFISYLAYFALPAIGPRFTLHDFDSLDVELPGLVLTSILRDIVNAGGGVAIGAADPSKVVNRDCMPSGHTMLTLVNIIIGFRNRSHFRWVFVTIGGSLIIATVYLRYHYVVDLLVGALLAVCFLSIEPTCNRFLERKFQKVSPKL
jgi:membrane-associated phospholipid phosphatase